MFGALLGPMIALGQAIKGGKAVASWNKAFKKMNAKKDKSTSIGGKVLSPEEKKMATHVNKLNAKINSPKGPLANVPTQKISTSKMNVGSKMQPYLNAQKMAPKSPSVPKGSVQQMKLPSQNKFDLNKTMKTAQANVQKQQNKAIGKQLSNPVSMESKIKKVMGVSD